MEAITIGSWSIITAGTSLSSKILSTTFKAFSRGPPQPLDPEEWNYTHRLESDDKQYIETWDIPLPQTGDTQNRKWEDRSDRNQQDASAEYPGNPTTQKHDVIRLSVLEGTRSRQPDLISEANPGSVGTSFSMLANMWRDDNPQQWYRLELYEPLIEFGHVAQVVRHIRIVGNSNHLRQVHIVCRTFVVKRIAETLAKSRFVFYPTMQFVSSLRRLDGVYQSFRTDKNWKQTFLLHIHHATLQQYICVLFSLTPSHFNNRTVSDTRSSANTGAPLKSNIFFRTTGAFDIQRDEDRSDVSWAELRQWRLAEITKMSYQYKQLSDIGHDLTNTTESLLDVVKASLTMGAIMPAGFQALEAELRGSCKEVRERLGRLASGLDHDLKFLDLNRSMNQNRGVQQLTLLATVFLPLSLAAGVLSMQTRFRDLGSLLYDFFGVVVLLGAVVLVLFLIMFLISFLRERESKLVKYEDYRESVRPLLLIGLSIMILVYGGLVLSSFVVGMFKDVDLGARILGYGTAVAFGLPLLILIPLLVFLLFLGLILASMSWLFGILMPLRKQEAQRVREMDPENVVPLPSQEEFERAYGGAEDSDPSEAADVVSASATVGVGVDGEMPPGVPRMSL